MHQKYHQIKTQKNMKIMVLPRDDKSKGKPFYSLLVGLG